jgi:hypothetical protein
MPSQVIFQVLIVIANHVPIGVHALSRLENIHAQKRLFVVIVEENYF